MNMLLHEYAGIISSFRFFGSYALLLYYVIIKFRT
ncbi:hypothetical protein SAMN05421739_101907 [Pontibacter chinhatensis]|uniref:Uncharacterized protein n=1 Tax=Pontibacter chinhatensis TaxID=1436961 RepID=A0A1I2P7G9_9BACT|nr:hypothetical protein SAMN05421739_101907 [Pontibacter chinhatensis]